MAVTARGARPAPARRESAGGTELLCFIDADPLGIDVDLHLAIRVIALRRQPCATVQVGRGRVVRRPAAGVVDRAPRRTRRGHRRAPGQNALRVLADPRNLAVKKSDGWIRGPANIDELAQLRGSTGCTSCRPSLNGNGAPVTAAGRDGRPTSATPRRCSPWSWLACQASQDRHACCTNVRLSSAEAGMIDRLIG